MEPITSEGESSRFSVQSDDSAKMTEYDYNVKKFYTSILFQKFNFNH